MNPGENPEIEEGLAQEQRKRALEKHYSGLYEKATEQLLEENDAAHAAELQARRKTEALNLEKGVLSLEKEALRQQAVEAIEKAHHDPLLKKLLNRAGFEELFNNQLNEMREKGTSGTLLLIDIDKFKEINDTLTHPGGDAALRTVEDYLVSTFRDTDLIARWGGEEFLIFLPDAATEEILKKFTPEGGEKAVINIPFEYEGHKSNITFSGGVTNFGPHDQLIEAVEKVDAALYRVKRNGRNELEFVTPDEAADMEEAGALSGGDPTRR